MGHVNGRRDENLRKKATTAELGERGIATRPRGIFRWTTIRGDSAMSRSSGAVPAGRDQSKW
ncbi:unnamed protein product [Spirodela intermedia]|uniref:Uncharacterized protein n=1 Tax=Spirodela intermedia TaxID=51605 RepID=A0A7I8L4M3_SPIIN|nr:unnamed protein product [Spirodela intermedia]